MDAFAIGGIVVGVLLLVGLVVLVVRRRGPAQVADPDPLFITGIGLSATGAALLATIGPVGIALVGTGLALMTIGISRTRHDRRPR